MMLTEREYSDFVFRFEVKLSPGGNNGVAIRTPKGGHPSAQGMEIQILDDSAEKHANLQPYQFHGSIYGIVPAKRGALKPPGEWNTEEIYAKGSHIRVTLNDQVIVDADLSQITDEEVLKKRPGLRQASGFLGFIGHGSRIEFRNLSIKELLPDNTPPAGFEALFNGTDLAGWKGLVANPPERAKMTPEQLAAAQEQADARMREHWSVQDGALVFDGKGDSLCTGKDYADFEFLVDWKILQGGDSGIYLRGSPQVQIWQNPVGSGGLYNNQQNPSQPLAVADNPVEQWNAFAIRMIGEQVWVWLNGKLVVDNVTLENYWERDKPIYPTGQIELQNHGNTLWFKNVYVKELTGE
ncbi:MAG: DUF1080 domain-containing protein [Armatimonadetes bacterium]|nr:DUF1080 domain-containing protein [Armatimonadota bacterium]